MFWERQKLRSAEEVARNIQRRHCARQITRQILDLDTGMDIERITLFGSVSKNRGKAGSDVDLGIIVSGRLSESQEDDLENLFHDHVWNYALENIPTTHLPLHLKVLSRYRYDFYLSINSSAVLSIENGIVLWNKVDCKVS